MSKSPTRYVGMRVPVDLFDRLQTAAAGESPAMTLTHEILSRIEQSFKHDAERERWQHEAADLRKELYELRGENRVLRERRR